jgi:hypothetical protein
VGPALGGRGGDHGQVPAETNGRREKYKGGREMHRATISFAIVPVHCDPFLIEITVAKLETGWRRYVEVTYIW